MYCRQDLAEKQRLKEERTAAAAAALKVNKAASLKAAANAQAARGAVDKVIWPASNMSQQFAFYTSEGGCMSTILSSQQTFALTSCC